MKSSSLSISFRNFSLITERDIEWFIYLPVDVTSRYSGKIIRLLDTLAGLVRNYYILISTFYLMIYQFTVVIHNSLNIRKIISFKQTLLLLFFMQNNVGEIYFRVMKKTISIIQMIWNGTLIIQPKLDHFLQHW